MLLIGLPHGLATNPLEGLQAALAALREAPEHALLSAYTAPYLTPPAPVRINTGMYIDGVLMEDGSAAMQLEFPALLHVRAAEAIEPGGGTATHDPRPCSQGSPGLR
ncbi:MAG: hypothetical protein ACLFTX_08335 [Thiohalospira sp.]